jgi:hypothetical protein
MSKAQHTKMNMNDTKRHFRGFCSPPLCTNHPTIKPLCTASSTIIKYYYRSIYPRSTEFAMSIMNYNIPTLLLVHGFIGASGR